MPRFPKVEDVLCEMLADLAPTVTRRDPNTPAPYIFIRRAGGNSDGITDRPVVRVEVLAGTRDESEDIAADVRDRILESGCTTAGGVLIDTATEITGTQQIPDFNPDERKVPATYRLSFRQLRH
ncbi:hypothetical protein [Prescottella agglutinans]|uniref:DUF3168 domain-containing protein n=1 Tax=Prescottella agglutinans TaxID=1644129 RepID=A0ABT6MHH0_9NOCA|nr:hypothetical protein [Prescottella agglutinans]MDH6282804.1 hypothetical protein [Prescottella agglutinans]